MPEKILITGGNGFLASHVIKKFLDSGYTVVTTVRDETKAAGVLSKLGQSNLSTVIVEDISSEDAFKKVIGEGNFDGIIHTAAPFRLDPELTPEDLVLPGIRSTKAVLQAAKKSRVKRVVLTSSLVAVLSATKGYDPGKVYKDDDWNPISYEETLKPGNLLQSYFGAKTHAERAAWDIIEKDKPHFDFVALVPPLIFGKVIHELDSLDRLNTSNKLLYRYISGALKGQPIPDLLTIPYWIDVEDLARAHVLAYKREASNKRIIVSVPKAFSNLEIAQILRKKCPERVDLIPSILDKTKYDDEGFPLGGYYAVDTSRSDEILGLKYKSLETMLGEMVDSLKEFNT